MNLFLGYRQSLAPLSLAYGESCRFGILSFAGSKPECFCELMWGGNC